LIPRQRPPPEFRPHVIPAAEVAIGQYGHRGQAGAERPGRSSFLLPHFAKHLFDVSLDHPWLIVGIATIMNFMPDSGRRA